MNRKYKIAVMGESNVGKTVFFGSYFHQATDLGKSRYTVAIKSQDSDDKITEIIKQLFIEKKIVPGTDVRVDFSFSVDKLGMDVELVDLPGGFTTNRNYWDDESVRKDLQDADGALFFISGYDLINNPAEALTVNRVFADAISEIRRTQGGKLKGRADVPIWFIFTKGDMIPNISDEELASRVPSLIDAAKSQTGGAIYKKGGYVRYYKSQAMGRWPDANTPPVYFEPVNVIEPVEELFEAMTLTKSSHAAKFAKIIAVLAIISCVGAEGFSFYVDREYFSSKKNNIEHLRETGNYAEAIQIIDGYNPPFTSMIMPAFMRAGRELKSIREETYREYETALYAPIEAEISKVNESRIPDIDEFFMDTLKKVEQYLDTTYFAQVNPEHYAKVRGSAWFFEAVRLFNTDPSKVEMTPDEEFEIILRCLNYEAPESWRDRIQSRVDNLLRHWGRTSPTEGAPENLDPYIDRASQLISHPNVSQEVASYLAGRVQNWQNEQSARWHSIAEGWIREANNLLFDDSLEFLSSHMAGKIPPEVRAILMTAHKETYIRIADDALQKYADDIDRLRSTVSKYSAMPSEAKDKLTARIEFLYEKMLEGKIKNIRSAKSIRELAKIYQELGDDVKANVISQAIISSLQNLTNARLQEIMSEVSSMAGNNNYTEAKHVVQSETSKLQQEIRSVVDDSRLISLAASKADEINVALMNAHYQYCRSYFTSRRNTTSTRDVSACLNEVRKYLQTWPDSLRTKEGAEVKQVAEFLESIQGGIQGRLIISEGNFKAVASITDTPDMKIVVRMGNDTWETDTITDKINPHFGAWISIRWSVDMKSINFRGIEVDPMFDDEVFSASVYPTGMKGFQELSRTLLNNGCSLTIKFDPSSSIPACPW